MLKDWLFKTSDWQLHKWFFGPEKFSGLSRNRLQVFLRTALLEKKMRVSPERAWGPMFFILHTERKSDFL